MKWWLTRSCFLPNNPFRAIPLGRGRGKTSKGKGSARWSSIRFSWLLCFLLMRSFLFFAFSRVEKQILFRRNPFIHRFPSPVLFRIRCPYLLPLHESGMPFPLVSRGTPLLVKIMIILKKKTKKIKTESRGWVQAGKEAGRLIPPERFPDPSPVPRSIPARKGNGATPAKPPGPRRPARARSSGIPARW